jgi:hypothetical protein
LDARVGVITVVSLDDFLDRTVAWHGAHRDYVQANALA